MKTSSPGEVRGVKSPFILPKSHLLSPKLLKGFPGGSAHPSAKQERRVPSLREKDPMGGNGNSLHDSFLENSMDRGAWWATVQGVAKSLT